MKYAEYRRTHLRCRKLNKAQLGKINNNASDETESEIIACF